MKPYSFEFWTTVFPTKDETLTTTRSNLTVILSKSLNGLTMKINQVYRCSSLSEVSFFVDNPVQGRTGGGLNIFFFIMRGFNSCTHRFHWVTPPPPINWVRLWACKIFSGEWVALILAPTWEVYSRSMTSSGVDPWTRRISSGMSSSLGNSIHSLI